QGHHDSTCFVLFIHLKASFIVMTNCRLANPHGVKIASRYRTIFGKQLRLLWSKRERFSPGKRSEKSGCEPTDLKNGPIETSVF
ncbi:hypothetical protein PJM44_29470, partial [Mycobacterium kansasii]